MVLQIRETMVLQKVELEGKGITSHFCVFGSFVALMGKHGFAEKLHLQLKCFLMKPDHVQQCAMLTLRNISIAVSEL
jgi:hypothetical protein